MGADPVYLLFLFLTYYKITCNGKSPTVLAFAPGRSSAGNKPVLQYAGGIGKIYMKYMARRYQLKANAQDIIKINAS